jgi:mRNA interferase HigB
MHIITRKRLLDFAQKYPACKSGLESWYRIIKQSNFNTIAELHKVFPCADQVGKFTVFNIVGNKARLIVAFHYNTQRVYIRHVLTHAEYDRNKWKE